MKRIGITGGIGSGKTTVAKVIESIGFPVFYSDIVSKEITNSNSDIRKEITALLGEDLYKDGVLNRSALAEYIFKDDTLLSKVNAIIHPHVRQEFENWAAHQTSQLVFNEAAILFETGAYKNLDGMILVMAPDNIRVHRVMQRDHCSKKSVLDRMANQWPDAQKIPLTNYVITNDDSTPLLVQIEKVIKELER